ncbi:MAG: methyltransferase domain-containing protein [Chloroflexota bacterium]|nr:methyltransferase domain-containing protein [Chloroflexota bacterium]
MRKRASRSKEYEVECIPGLEAFAMDELNSCDAQSLETLRPGFLRFRFAGDSRPLLTLRSAIAVYGVHRFEVPRPKALLGHQHLTRLIGILRAAMRDWTLQNPRLGLGAAGANSQAITRLKEELARLLNVELAEENKGELYLRLARPIDRSAWEVLVRLGPRPLSKRDWRIINVPGALNATVAYAMTQIQSRDAQDRVLNLCCGSGTILVEHAHNKTSDQLLAVDNSANMLSAAGRNLRASDTKHRVILLHADAGRTPLPSRAIDRIYADLPFGGHVGSHADNLRLYPALLREAYRVSKPDAVLILLTHEVNLLRNCIAQSNWRTISETKITLSGLHPRLFVLKAKSTTIYM